MNDRVVITGLGLICAIGSDVDECFDNALAGKVGIKEVKSVEHSGCYAHIGGENNGFVTPDGEDRASALCIKAAEEAVADSGEGVFDDPSRVGVVVGSCVGGAVSIEIFYRDYVADPDKSSGEDVLKMPISAIANNVALRFGAQGAVDNVANACAAGTMSIAIAADLIRSGKADAVIAGGSDPMSSLAFSGFHALHALDDEPCRPFNKSKGIALGEGAGVLIVESYEHAKKRGAKVYCEVLGSGVSSDAHHITAPAPDGEGMQAAMERSLGNSGIKASDVDYINAHGTGTPLNDSSELGAMLRVFGDEGKVSCSTTKSMVGHCLGAAGSVEAVMCVKAIERGIVPPTAGYADGDISLMREKAGNFDFVPNKGKQRKVEYVQSNNYAFGGNNASIIYAKEDAPRKLAEPNDERVFVTGFGIVGPLGNTAEEYAANVNAGAEAKKCEECGDFVSSVGREDFDAVGIKLGFYRKLDKLSQMTCVSGKRALANAGIEVTDDNARRIGIVAGTSDGPQTEIANFQKGIIENGTEKGSAFMFPNTVYNAAPGYLSIAAGIKGYNVTLSNGAASGIAAVAFAKRALLTTQNDVILAVGADEDSETVHMLYGKIGALGKGMILGDGATTVVLERGSSADARGAKKYAEVLGSGFAHCPTEFGKYGCADKLKEAIALALAESGITEKDVSTVVTCSNGTASLGKAEEAALAGLAGAKRVNVKALCGESRAASSALSVAHAAMMLGGMIGGDAGRYVLALGASAGGSYNAVVLAKA